MLFKRLDAAFFNACFGRFLCHFLIRRGIGQIPERNAETVEGKLCNRAHLNQLVQSVFSRIFVVFDAELLSDLLGRELLLGVTEQVFEDFDLKLLGG